MAKKTQKKKKSPASIFLRIFCVLTILFLLGSIVAQALDFSENKSVLQDRTQVLAEQKKQNENIKNDIENGNDLNFIERCARALGYVFPDERVHVDNTPDGNN